MLPFLKSTTGLLFGRTDELVLEPDLSPNRKQRLAAWAIVVIALTVAVAFPVRLCLELAGVGENVLGYDYTHYIHQFNLIFSGNYNWAKLPMDSMITGGSHCLLIPQLIRLPLLMLTGWSHNAEVFLGVAFALVKVLLLFHLLSRGSNAIGRAVVLALVSGLTFSLSHFVSFQFGPAAFNQQLADVFFLAGCCFLIHQPRFWVLGLAMCGMFASWSYGSGVFCWPAYGAGFLLCRVRGWRSYLGLCFGASLAAVPYVLYRVLGEGVPRVAEQNWFPIKTWLQSFTLPFFTIAEMNDHKWPWLLVGITGFVLCVLCMGLAFLRCEKTQRTRLAPASMILLYALATLGMISFGRITLAPWYSVHYAMLWVGILGFAMLLDPALWRKSSKPLGYRIPRGLGRITFFTTCFFCLVLVPNNRKVEGKTFFLTSRSPVAMSAYREFRTASTQYASYPFSVWRVNHWYLVHNASLLEKHGWSVFGKDRVYLLQGDFGLNQVTLSENYQAPPMIWIRDRKPKAVAFTHYERLNLLLPASQAISWEVEFPQEVSRATFQTASAKPSTRESLADCEVLIQTDTQAPRVVWTNSDHNAPNDWESCSIPLSEYAGQTVRITLRSQGDFSTSAAVWRTPRISMQLSSIPAPKEGVIPSNTNRDLFPAFTHQDLSLQLTHQDWQPQSEFAVPDGESPLGWNIVSGKSQLAYVLRSEISTREYSHLILQCRLTHPFLNFHNVAVKLEGEMNGRKVMKEAVLSLLANEEMQAYCLDLRKLEILPDMKITKLILEPGSVDSTGQARQFQLAEARWIKRQHGTEPNR